MDHEESPELIQARMEDTRQSLTDKVAALEQTVVGTLQTTTSTVQETVESIKAAVQDTVQSVKGGLTDTVQSVKGGVSETMQTVAGEVRQKLDITHQVRENPWLMVGGAAVAGLFTGLLVFGRRPTGLPPASSGHPGSSHAPAHLAAVPSAGPHTPSGVDDLLGVAGQKVKQLAEEALNTVVHSARQNMNDKIPTLIGTALGNVGSSGGDRSEPEPGAGESPSPWGERGRLTRTNGIH